jgi:uncharacterized RDD family membrane protein YckC
MKPRFQPDLDPSLSDSPPATLVDPEAYDASEQQFAASLEDEPRPKFVVEAAGPGNPTASAVAAEAAAERPTETAASSPPIEADATAGPDPDAWRQEVAARVTRYRTRRHPRSPRYPSLQLKFESTEPSWDPQPGTSQPPVNAGANRLAVATQYPAPVPLSAAQPAPALPSIPLSILPEADTGAKVLEFPRLPSFPPPVSVDELAGPVFDRPRIMEVPEVLPPPPALGGMLIEREEEPAAERRPGFELPLRAAPMGRRLLASAIDAFLVVLAFTVFAYIFFRITATIPTLRQAAGVSSALIAAFWAGYQYLLLVYAGTTPGLRLAKLQLSRFDGDAVPRKLRRWRVLASILSGMSLALGYAWCFLDEDELCWHDRITRTYMAPTTQK